jgi:hypothetical protein
MPQQVKIHSCTRSQTILLGPGLLENKDDKINVNANCLNQRIWMTLYRLPRVANKAIVRIMDPYVRIVQAKTESVVYDNLHGVTFNVEDKRLMQTPWFRRRRSDSPWRMQLMMSPSLFQCAPGTCYWVPSHPSLNDLIDIVVTQPSAPGVSEVRLTMNLMNQFQTYNVACRPAKKQGQRYYVFDVVVSPKTK